MSGIRFTVFDKKTHKEADPYEIALHEEWAKELCYCDMVGFAIGQDGTLFLVDECGRYEFCDPERFIIRWDEMEFTTQEAENVETKLPTSAKRFC